MYKQAIAVFTATSAVLAANAWPARADGGNTALAAQCSNRDAISINVSPPPPLTGTVRAEDIRGLLQSMVAGTSLQGFFSPGLDMPDVGLDAPAAPGLAPIAPQPHATPGLAPLAPQPYAAASPGADAAAPGELSPARTMLQDLVRRALACVGQPGAAPGTMAMPPFTIPQLLEALVTTPPAACAPATAPAASTPAAAGAPVEAPATPAASPASVLDALGVQRLLDTLLTHPAACANLAPPAPGPATSLLDAIGITGLFHEMTGD
ncbi:hypothetical protein SAMN05444920_112287 [Nonomuraea solani]|uniref:Uncharacterized protein n=1 Tax=Nonomuraea solani TaxID=1144553 RepID=A0A1H6EQB6_9ACTN|nr:hypothetical protein [Nonomuraea solani]SEG99206.1 hypothetical protein SAMN05444920_112287 [Nonomuraea solani]